MKKPIFTFSFFAILMLTSCKNVFYSGSSLEPGISFNGTSNAILELYVDTTNILKGSSTTKITLGIFISSDHIFSDAYMKGDEDYEKRAATYKALQNTNYDLIVLPKYRIEYSRTLFTRTSTCYVEGYGGKYELKNVKYINNSNQKVGDVKNEVNPKEMPNYKREKSILNYFMEEIELYQSCTVSNPFELSSNDIVMSPNNSFGIVISNNGGSIKYLTNQSDDKFEIINDNYSNLKKMKKN